jgi:hypothetical protein
MLPPERLREGLAAWRASPWHHATFDAVWEPTVRAVLASCDDARFWAAVFDEQRDAWRRAYDLEPMTAAEFALVGVRDDLPLGDVDRRCERDGCEQTIPRDVRKGGARRRYCGETCRRKAERELRISHDREVPNSVPQSTSRGGSTMSEPPILTH